MSYEVKVDGMVGKHMAEFQAKLTLSAKPSDIGLKPPIPPMPYGYPILVYHPYHSVVLPKSTKFKKHAHGKLSNDVPWVLAMEVVHDYPVGVYNPTEVISAAGQRNRRVAHFYVALRTLLLWNLQRHNHRPSGLTATERKKELRESVRDAGQGRLRPAGRKAVFERKKRNGGVGSGWAISGKRSAIQPWKRTRDAPITEAETQHSRFLYKGVSI
jgi:hypothetical protein